MSDAAAGFNLQAELSRLEHQREETLKFVAEQHRIMAETAKLAAEQNKLMAEQTKLYAEGRKYNRDPWFLLAGALIAAATARLDLVLRAFGVAP